MAEIPSIEFLGFEPIAEFVRAKVAHFHGRLASPKVVPLNHPGIQDACAVAARAVTTELGLLSNDGSKLGRRRHQEVRSVLLASDFAD